MTGLPLQPRPPAPRWLVAALLLAGTLGGLALLGGLGLQRRMPGALLTGGPDLPPADARTVERHIAGARQRVWILQYVVRADDGPVGALLQALVDARARGVDVRVALDRGRLPDGQPDAKNDAAAAWLRDRGMTVVWDEEDRTSHAKIVIADGQAVVGSHNWTRSALLLNREVSLLITGPAEVASLAALLTGIPGWDAAGAHR